MGVAVLATTPLPACTQIGEALDSDCAWVSAVVTDDGRVVIPCGQRRTGITRSTSQDDPLPLRDAGPPTPWVLADRRTNGAPSSASIRSSYQIAHDRQYTLSQ